MDIERHTFRSPAFRSVVEEAIAFFEGTPAYELPPPGRFVGCGVYALYYRGGYELCRGPGPTGTPVLYQSTWAKPCHPAGVRREYPPRKEARCLAGCGSTRGASSRPETWIFAIFAAAS